MPSSTKASSLKRAVGVVRVSRVGGRDGEQFVSPSEQAERIRTACERAGLELVDTIEELDVSGGASLEKRHGLRRAVEMVEAERSTWSSSRTSIAWFARSPSRRKWSAASRLQGERSWR